MIAAAFLLAALETAGVTGEARVTADRITVDNITKAAVATGHVHATCGVVTLRSEAMSRDEKGVAHFDESTCVTTCTNDVGHTHWNVTGEVEYQARDHVLVRNAWLRFYEIPIFYLPYLWYPLDTDCGFSWMPGWTDQWGPYLLTKYSYHIIGDSSHDETTWWLRGDTRFDLRYEQGIALGQDLNWNLNGFGAGKFKVYYAWDRSDDYDDSGLYRNGDYNYYNWGSDVPEDRWAMEFSHRWEPTERDVVRVKGSVQSDTYFRDDFFRDSLFNIKNQWLGYAGNEVAWEHLENSVGFGVSASGPLNKFYGGTSRLPEIYFDVNPMPVFALPVNYESQTRIGYLGRQPAEHGDNRAWYSSYGYNPGNWADYDTFRIDTYHRLTAPFRTFDDVLAVVPRVGYRATYWNASGGTHLSGYDQEAAEAGGDDMIRSIVEAGTTFSMRGTADVNDRWSHLTEPYLDLLAQEAMYNGAGGGRRPYVFDNLDASMMWEDQFAGRGRNLPYSYYGLTPGWRNAWRKSDDRGNVRTIADFDVYAAIQLNRAELYDDVSGYPAGRYHGSEWRSLAEPGSPNYGDSDFTVMPGARVRWMPDETITLMGNIEMDTDRKRVASADLGWKQKLNEKFSYYVKYALRDYRYWDYAPSAPAGVRESRYGDYQYYTDDLNHVHFHTVNVGFEHHVLDWFHWSPFVRWDIKDGEVDCVGAWFDYLVDCLGFRLIVSYDNEYRLYDGYDRGDNLHVGFMIYLRALGVDGSNIFGN